MKQLLLILFILPVCLLGQTSLKYKKITATDSMQSRLYRQGVDTLSTNNWVRTYVSNNSNGLDILVQGTGTDLIYNAVQGATAGQTVFVGPGTYIETGRNLFKNGVKYKFMPGAHIIDGYFDITNITSDVIIQGDLDWTGTGKFLYTTAQIKDSNLNGYVEYNSITASSSSRTIDFANSSSTLNNTLGTWVFKSKTKTINSGNYSLYSYRDNFKLLSINGNWDNSSTYGTIYINTYAGGKINVDINANIKNKSTGTALTLGNTTYSNITGNITGTNAVSVPIYFGQNLTWNLLGCNVSGNIEIIYSNNNDFGICNIAFGAISNGNFTVTNASQMRVKGQNLSIKSFSNVTYSLGQNVTLNVGCGTNYKRVLFGTLHATSYINFNESVTLAVTSATVSSGNVIFNDLFFEPYMWAGSGSRSYIAQSGGFVEYRGLVVGETSPEDATYNSGAMIRNSGGVVKWNNSTVRNECPFAGNGGVKYTGNCRVIYVGTPSFFVANTAGLTYPQEVQAGVTVTVENRGNWWQNIATQLNLTGVMNSLFIGAGQEFVDINLTQY